jgi:Immunoglobulin domain
VNGAKIINTNGRQKTGELVLTNVTEHDSGTYVCDAFNGIGTAQKVFYLVVNGIP